MVGGDLPRHHARGAGALDQPHRRLAARRPEPKAALTVGATDETARRACAIASYPRDMEEIVTTRDGRRVLMRPVRAEDEAAFQANFAKFSPETIRRRFFGPLKMLTQAAASRLTHIDYEREMALVLTDPDPPESGEPEGYGVARIIADAQGRGAEFALIVRDDMMGQGLGTALMHRLIAFARERGLEHIRGDVLPENNRMIALCRRLGFVIEGRTAGGPIRVRLQLSARENADKGG